MYTREMINFTDRNYNEMNHIPKWARDEEMGRKADSLIENGFTVERSTGVRSTTGICFTTFQVLYWD